MNGADPLADLRDIHLPEPVSWWPPAPGWWLLVLLALALLAVLGWWLRRAWRRHRRRARVEAELDALLAAHRAGGDARALAAGVSLLLKRVALARWPRPEVAGLSGADWLAFLDRTGGHGDFADGPGRALARAGYGAPEPVEAEALGAAARAWIRGVLKGGRA